MIYAVIDPNWGESKILLNTIRDTEKESIEAALVDPKLGLYSGGAFSCTPIIKGKWEFLQRNGYRTACIDVTFTGNSSIQPSASGIKYTY